MKKAVLTVTALGFTLLSIAQDKYVTSALTALGQKNLEEAKTDIDRAMNSPETKEKPKALFAKAQIYFSLQQVEKYKSGAPYREGSQALIRLVEVKPEYEKEQVNPILFYGAIMYYNDGTLAFNDKKYTEATDLLKQTIRIHDLSGGKRFEKFQMAANFDTVAANAAMSLARIAYYEKNYEEALKQLNKLKTIPIFRSADNYITLLNVYDQFNTANANKLGAEELAAVQEARTAFPADANIRNMELNTYLRMGKLNDMVKKMEESAVAEPNNADVAFNLGLLYQGIANPKEGAKPANAEEYIAKAEKSFAKAVQLAPENSNYNANFGTLYYMQAYSVNEKMNAITGSSKKEMDEYDKLKVKRDDFFNKALPYLEKATSLYGANKSMSDTEKDNYYSSLQALRQVYAAQNKTEKMTEVSNKLKELNQ